MSENIYEALFILDTAKYNRDPETVSNQISETIESMGGQVRVSRLWEERKLAYPIKNHRRGTYWLAYFRLDTDKVADLNRQFQLNGSIIRFLLTTIDPRLEDALVDNALNGPAKVEEANDVEASQTVYDDADDEDDEDEDEDSEE